MGEFQDIQDDYGFHFLDDVTHPLIRMNAVGIESRYSGQYYWDNSDRPGGWLFQYTLSGSGTVEIGGRKQVLEPGMGFFVKLPGPERYYFDEGRNAAPWKLIFILFECREESYYQYIEERLGKVFSVPYYSDAIQLLFDIHRQAKEGKNLNPFFFNSKVFEFLCCLCALDKDAKADQSGLILRARKYLDSHFDGPIGIGDTADFLGVSQSHLSREFYRATGMKPVDYLTRLRLKRAIHLLHTTAWKMEEVSSACGFSSSNYFNKVFKKYMDMTPQQFRTYAKTQGYISVQI